MNVSAVLVTRGDVDLGAIVGSLDKAGIDDIVVWDNSKGKNLSVYGRYAGIEHAKHDLIYVQDDDCVVSDPQALVLEWGRQYVLTPVERTEVETYVNAGIVANMPQSFRHDFYSDHCLVGFGAVFHRDLPEKVFGRFWLPNQGGVGQEGLRHEDGLRWFHRTCDVVFTALTPRVLVDVEYQDLPWASDDNRMWKQNGHVAERTRMLELVRKVRDAD